MNFPRSFYVPKVQELENSQDDSESQATDRTSGNCQTDDTCYHNNFNPMENCYYNNGNCQEAHHLANSFGSYTISFPLVIRPLKIPTLYPASIIKGDLSISIDNQVVLNYNKLFFDQTSGITSNTLSCNLNNRTFQVGAQDTNVTLYLKGNIQIQTDKNPDFSIDNPMIHTHVFDNCLEIIPFENLDDCNPSLYEIYCPNLDNTGSLLIDYTYVNRQFSIRIISLTTAFSVPKPFI